MKWISTSPTATWCENIPLPTEALPQLSITNRRQQVIESFGGCFNEMGWQVLQTLSRDRRKQVLHDLFDSSTGCGYSLMDPLARSFVSGVGYQWAGKGAVQRTHQSWPELRLLQTENECGDGSNTWEYAHYVFTLVHHYLSNGVNGYLYWNMVLPPGGRSTWGWAQNSMITVDATQQTVTYNPEFYVMKHLAHFVISGSVRLDLQGPWSGNALAFHTPEQSTVVVCANPFGEQVEVVIAVAGERFVLRLDAYSLNTVVFES